MFHVPAHKNVQHPAGQRHPGLVDWENLYFHQVVERAVLPPGSRYFGTPDCDLES